VNNDVPTAKVWGTSQRRRLPSSIIDQDGFAAVQACLDSPLPSFVQARVSTGGRADATSERQEAIVRWVEFSGYVASSLVFLTFYMRGMASLRLIALCSNAAFLIYAGSLHLLPILLLHGALIPVNACRLRAAWQSGSLPDFLSATGSSGTNSMNYRAFTNDSLAMMYAGIRGSLAVDDVLVGQGEETRFRVRETADWTRHAADLETEMIRREMAFEVIDWSRRLIRRQSPYETVQSAVLRRSLVDQVSASCNSQITNFES
jgi:hypothetical protein